MFLHRTANCKQHGRVAVELGEKKKNWRRLLSMSVFYHTISFHICALTHWSLLLLFFRVSFVFIPFSYSLTYFTPSQNHHSFEFQFSTTEHTHTHDWLKTTANNWYICFCKNNLFSSQQQWKKIQRLQFANVWYCLFDFISLPYRRIMIIKHFKHIKQMLHRIINSKDMHK